MAQKYIIAYDLGTSGVKVALIDLHGHFLCDETENYSLLTPHPGWAEQNPMEYWEGVCSGTKRVLQKSGCRPEDAQGVVFGTQWKGIIPIDANGNVLHNSIIWLDARAQQQSERLNAHFQKDIFCAADYWPKLLWFRENHADLYERADIIFEANSFLKWKATGEAWVDTSNHFIRSLDEQMQDFYLEYLHFCRMDIDKFPPLAIPSDMVGHITDAAAAEMGLVPGVPVFAGCTDVLAIAIGAGSTQLGGMHAYFGSSGWLGLTKAHTFDLCVSPFDKTRDITMCASMQAIGLSLNWTLSRLYQKEMEELGGGIFDFLTEELEDIPPGCEGVLATPWFYGERPPNFSELARGNFLNLNSCHTRKHMVKAMMEGVCYTLKMNVEAYWTVHGAKPAYINAVGGGACSPIWMQALADILEVPINVPRNPRHAGAVGTAYCALIGLGYCSSFEDAATQIEIAHSFQPRPDAMSVYRAAYPVFKGLYTTLEPLFAKMNT